MGHTPRRSMGGTYYSGGPGWLFTSCRHCGSFVLAFFMRYVHNFFFLHSFIIIIINDTTVTVSDTSHITAWDVRITVWDSGWLFTSCRHSGFLKFFMRYRYIYIYTTSQHGTYVCITVWDMIYTYVFFLLFFLFFFSIHSLLSLLLIPP